MNMIPADPVGGMPPLKVFATTMVDVQAARSRANGYWRAIAKPVLLVGFLPEQGSVQREKSRQLAATALRRWPR